MEYLNKMIDDYFELYEEWWQSIEYEADWISGELEILEEKAKKHGLNLGKLYSNYRKNKK